MPDHVPASSEHSQPFASPRLRFDRNELAGAFGDIGTDLPLIVGMILAARLDSASVLIMFGLMQIFTGLTYGLPIPVQPLKAMAAIVISQKLAGSILYGGGLAIGVVMLLLTVTGLVAWLARAIPTVVIRGIQFGLGLQLASLALRQYVPAEGIAGYVLAAASFLIILALLGNRRYPAALLVIALGIVYALATTLDVGTIVRSVGVRLPASHVPRLADIFTGLIILALPQIPLSLGNSVLATRQTAQDLFADRAPPLRKISLTYAAMNLVNPFLSGIPTCHGSGGLVGHYTFGARTGGSVVIYGTMYLILGLFLGRGVDRLLHVFPLPVLGILLLFEGLGMMLLVGRLEDPRKELHPAILTGLIAGLLPYGYLMALVVGPLLLAAARYRGSTTGSEKTPR